MGHRCSAFVLMLTLIAASAPGIAATPAFSGAVIQIIRDSYSHAHDDGGKAKSGKQKQNALPPGIAKNLARGNPLPPGIAKKALPGDLNRRLPPVRDGYDGSSSTAGCCSSKSPLRSSTTSWSTRFRLTGAGPAGFAAPVRVVLPQAAEGRHDAAPIPPRVDENLHGTLEHELAGAHDHAARIESRQVTELVEPSIDQTAKSAARPGRECAAFAVHRQLTRGVPCYPQEDLLAGQAEEPPSHVHREQERGTGRGAGVASEATAIGTSTRRDASTGGRRVSASA